MRRSAPVEVSSDEEAIVRPGPFAVSLRLLEGTERKRFLHEALGSELDPFPSEDGRRSFVTIRMEVRNDAPEPLLFNPQRVVLETDRPDYIYPLDATRAYEEFRRAGLDPDALMPTVARILYDTAVTLAPGKTIARLLVYSSPAPEVKQARLAFEFFSLGRASFSFAVPMRQILASVTPPAGADP